VLVSSRVSTYVTPRNTIQLTTAFPAKHGILGASIFSFAQLRFQSRQIPRSINQGAVRRLHIATTARGPATGERARKAGKGKDGAGRGKPIDRRAEGGDQRSCAYRIPPSLTVAKAKPFARQPWTEKLDITKEREVCFADKPVRTKQFTLFDLDKDGKIDYHELKVAMKALGFDLPKPEILSILQTHGQPTQPPASNTASVNNAYHHSRLLLTFQSFQTIMTQKILARDPTEEILRAFDLFDEGSKGRISLDDLRRVARELGEGLEEEELRAMIDEFDLDGDGAINRDEFLGICLQ